MVGLALFACAFVTPADRAQRVDADGDGYVADEVGGDDCDDTDPAVNPGAAEECDAAQLDEDCDGKNVCEVEDAPFIHGLGVGGSAAYAGEALDLPLIAVGVGSENRIALVPFSGQDVNIGVATSTAQGENAGDGFGATVVSADFNDDGLQDLAVGAPTWDNASVSGVDHGAVYGVFAPFPSGDATLGMRDWGFEDGGQAGGVLAVGSQTIDAFERDVVLIGEPAWEHNCGYATLDNNPFVVSDDLSGLPETHGARFRSLCALDATADDRVGAALAFGDVDGDGSDDILIGAPGSDIGRRDAGAAYLWVGSAWGNNCQLDGDFNSKPMVGRLEGDAAGSAVAMLDVTGDGHEDMVVTAPSADEGGVDGGAVYFADGDIVSGINASVDGAFELVNAAALVGTSPVRSLTTPGDVDDDGREDLVLLTDDGVWLSRATHVSGTFVIEDIADVVPCHSPGCGAPGFVSGGGNVDGETGADILLGLPAASGEGAIAILSDMHFP